MESHDEKKSGTKMKFNPNDPKHWKDFDPFAKATNYIDGKSESQINKAKANQIKAEDIVFRQKQKEAVKNKINTQEWKDNQLKGIRTVRAKGSWQENVKKGALKREQENTFNRAELNKKLIKSKKWRDAVKQGMKDRWDKPENLSTCPHCGKTCDNANYKKWHGDNCKLKGKK